MNAALYQYPVSARVALSEHSEAWDELDGLIAAGITYRNYSQTHGMQRLARLENRIVQLLADPDQGFAVLDIEQSLDSDPSLADKARLLLVAIGNQFGQTVTRNHFSGSPFFPVFHRHEGKGGMYIGNALSNNRPGIHTDGSGLHDARVDFMALLCIRPASRGGESVVVNATRVYHELPSNLQFFLLRRAFIRQNPYDPENPYPPRRPIYHQVKTQLYSGLGIQYHRSRIEGGHQRMGEPLDSQDIQALDTLDSSLYSSRNTQTFQLRSGAALLANNHVVCHDRTAFEDCVDSPRLLERYWAGEYVKENNRA